MRVSWSELLRVHLEALRLRGLSPSTLEIARVWCGRFLEFCRADGAGSPGAATERQLARWRRQLEKRSSLAPATVALALQNVKAWLTWAHRENLLLVNPAADLVVKRPPFRSRRCLTEEEAERLMELPALTPCGLRDRALLEVMYSAGLRAGECCRLDLTDLDMAQSQLWVRGGKGGKDRLLPMGDSLHEALTAWLVQGRPAWLKGEEPALFLGRHGGRLSYNTLSKRMNHLMTLAGLTGRLPTAHSLRRSCATHMLRNGAELRQVADFLGHAWVSSTEAYTRLQALDLVREHERTHPRVGRQEGLGPSEPPVRVLPERRPRRRPAPSQRESGPDGQNSCV